MKKLYLFFIISSFYACKPATKIDTETIIDSTENASEKKVDSLLLNDDSLIKAKEKELLEKYK